MKLDLTFEPNITKDFILSHVSEEDIFCYYMNIPNIQNKLYKSVIRVDHNPTCGFFRGNSRVLYLKDFATGDCMNCFALVMAKFNCDFGTSLKIIASDFNLYDYNNTYTPVITNKNTFKEKGPTIIQIEMQKFTDQDLIWWSNYGITLETLKKFNVYSCKNVFLNNALYATTTNNNLMFGYYFGKQDKRELWKIYFPLRKTHRFINNLDSKRLQGFKQLPETGKLLVITKSQKDIMCLYELGIPAVSPNSEHLFPSNEQLEGFKKRFNHIVVFYDNDRTGLARLVAIRKEHPELNYVFIPRNTKCKDISDYYKAKGKMETIKLIRQYLIYLKNKHNEIA